MKRQFPTKIKRIVVKVGSSILTSSKRGIDKNRLKNIVDQISKLTTSGIEVVLVSSGAIASGMSALKISSRPGKLPHLQAIAAIGQSLLMQAYNELFKKNSQICAQVLLTREDFSERQRYINARNTIYTLLEHKVIPIINENDTISTDEIKFGDNDCLSALTANLIAADLLILLSDVDGLYRGKGSQRHVVSLVDKIDGKIKELATDTAKKNISVGGMISKLEAAKIAADSGIPCLITNGKTKDILLKSLMGKEIGTLFIPQSTRLEAKKRWIAYSAKSQGKIVIDNGAKEALVKKGKSLLCPGIIGLEGTFRSGDIVIIIDSKGKMIAKGLSNYSKEELSKVKGKKISREVVHRNDLVITAEE